MNKVQQEVNKVREKIIDVREEVVDRIKELPNQAKERIQTLPTAATNDLARIAGTVQDAGENILNAAPIRHRSWLAYCRKDVIVVMIIFALFISGIGCCVYALVLRRWAARFTDFEEARCLAFYEEFIPSCDKGGSSENYALDCLVVEYIHP